MKKRRSSSCDEGMIVASPPTEPPLKPQRRHWSALVPKNAHDRPSARTKLHVNERLPLVRLEDGCELASSGYTVFDFLEETDIIEGVVPLHEAPTAAQQLQQPTNKKRRRCDVADMQQASNPESTTGRTTTVGGTGATQPPPLPPHGRIDCSTTSRRAPIATARYVLDDNDYLWCDDSLVDASSGLNVLVPQVGTTAAHHRLAYVHALVVEAFTTLERLYAHRLLAVVMAPSSHHTNNNATAAAQPRGHLPSCAVCGSMVFAASEPGVPLRCCQRASRTVRMHDACHRYATDHSIAHLTRCAACLPHRQGGCMYCKCTDTGNGRDDSNGGGGPLAIVGDLKLPWCKMAHTRVEGTTPGLGAWAHAICAVVAAADVARSRDADGSVRGRIDGCAQRRKGRAVCEICGVANDGLLSPCAAGGCAAQVHPSCAARWRLVSRTYAPGERSPVVLHAACDPTVFSLQTLCLSHDGCVNVVAPPSLLGARDPRALDASSEASEYAVHALHEHWTSDVMEAVDVACGISVGSEDVGRRSDGISADAVRRGARERVFSHLLARVVAWWKEKRLEVVARAVRRAESSGAPSTLDKQPMVRKVSRTEVALSHHVSLIPQLHDYLAEFLDGIPPYRERLDFPGGEEQRRERLDREGDCVNQLARLNEVKRSLREMAALTQLVHSRAEKEHELVLLRTQLLHM